MMKDIGGNLRVGQSDIFLAEACEYTNSFHSFFPSIAVILNVEADHLDFFKDINEIRDSFKTLLKGCRRMVLWSSTRIFPIMNTS